MKKKSVESIETDLDGTPLSKGFRRCRQSQCAYFLGHGDGCRECDDCHTKPYVIKSDCIRCIRCSSVPNTRRWGDPKVNDDLTELNKEMDALRKEVDGLVKDLEEKGLKIIIKQ